MRFFKLLTCVLMLAAVMFAQGDRGTITGTIIDPGGAVVPNAPIVVKNSETGATYQIASTTTGNYTLPGLPAGTYELNVTVSGFKTYTRTGLTIAVAATVRIDVALELGNATESVTVSDAAPLLKTESGELSHNVTSDRLNTLPVLGIGAGQAGSSGIRNPNAVLSLIPGAYYTANSEVRVNGAPDNTQSLRIEGLDATNSGTPGTPAQSQPSVDAIQEITVQTSNFAAEYGQVGGGFFNVTMKSGTNKFHGTGYDYLVNEALNAAQPFTDNGSGGKIKTRARRQDYGFTIGGPVLIPKIYDGHDKTFFFFNWEEFREFTLQNTTSQTVPAAAYRTGDFSRALTGRTLCPSAACTAAFADPRGNSILEGQVFDPNSTQTVSGVRLRDAFAGNQIPVARFDPVAAKIQNLIPLPLGPNANSLTLNYLPTYKADRVTHIPAIKIDQNIGSKDKISFYWSKTNTSSAIAPGLGNADGLPDPITSAIGTFIPSYVSRLNYDRTLTPTMLLHLGIGYQSVDQGVPSVNTDGTVRNYDVEKEIGLKGGIINKFFPTFSGLTFGGGTGGMKNFGSQSDTHNYTQKPTFNASLTDVRGNHSFKYGAELRLEGYPAKNFGTAGGAYGFSYAQTAQPYWNGNLISGTTSGFPYASFLLGQVNNGTIGNPVTPRLGKKQLGIFVQDTWKLTRKLTLDYGLRYDYSTYLQEQYNRIPWFSENVVNPTVGRNGGVIFDQTDTLGKLAKNYPLAFGPRLGVSYQLDSKTVVRAGFGVVYNGTAPNNNAGGGLANSTNNFTTSQFGDPITTLAVGIPTSFRPVAWPNTNPGLFPLTRTSAPAAMPAPRLDQNAGRPARQYQWSIGIQREVTRDLVIEASYVANRGVWWNAPALLNLNALTPAMLQSAGLDFSNAADRTLLTSTLSSAAATARGFNTRLPYSGFSTGQTVAQSLRAFPQFTTIQTYWDPLGKTWYDSLQAKATQRLSHGLSLTGTFTWSRSLQLGAERDPNPGSTGNVVTNDVFNRNNNKYLSLHDQPFLFNIAATYLTPAAMDQKVVKWLTRDWSIGTYLAYGSGLPLPVPTANNNLSNQLFQGTFANRVAGEPLFTADLNCHCFDPSTTFVLNPKAWSDPAAGQFGSSTAYYTDFRKQRRPNENLNVGRTFRLKEGITLNVRAEFTNIFNRWVVNNPVSGNANQAQTRNANGTTNGGFGFIDRTTQTGGTTAAIVNISPRSGVLVGRITF